MIYVTEIMRVDPLQHPRASVSGNPNETEGEMVICSFTPSEFKALMNYEGVVWREIDLSHRRNMQ